MRKLNLFVKEHRDLLAYLFFGALTTAVNYAVYLPLYNLLHWTATLSNILAWAVAVVFAYVTNKPFVFHSNDWSMGAVLPEFAKFVGCRIASGVLETGLIFLFIDILSWNGNIFKIITSILVVILNYFGSKILVFQRKK